MGTDRVTHALDPLELELVLTVFPSEYPKEGDLNLSNERREIEN